MKRRVKQEQQLSGQKCLDQKLFKMANREEMMLPDSLQNKIDDILVGLPKRRKYRMTWKKAVLLAAVLTVMFSITVTAAVSALQQRMEEIGRAHV